jgi:hypothetical protein
MEPTIPDTSGSKTSAATGEVDATPDGMPTTGAQHGNSLPALALTLAAVVALLAGLSMWEKRGGEKGGKTR